MTHKVESSLLRGKGDTLVNVVLLSSAAGLLFIVRVVAVTTAVAVLVVSGVVAARVVAARAAGVGRAVGIHAGRTVRVIVVFASRGAIRNFVIFASGRAI